MRTTRRRAARGLLAAAATVPLAGHTPYRQWVVYRQRHLLIGCHREDPEGYALAKALEFELWSHLPDSSARVARAPHAERLASLLATAQLEVALLDTATALAMRAGEGPFAAYGALDLVVLARLENRLLLARADFPARHAWLVAEALAESPLVLAPAESPLAWHPGALAFHAGMPEPSEP